jgi:coenzyme F420-reducing hydrogenase beta subunit
MQADEEGFLYPLTDEALCADCGLCKSACPLKNELNMDRLQDPLAFALKHKSDIVRMSSSSGGAYTAISDFVISNTDSTFAIYGAGYDKENGFSVRHSAAYSSTERDNFKCSKYVQSNLGQAFNEIKQTLIDGKTVLFTGTPCQTAGLVKFLEVSKTDMANLIPNDIICHGTPSPGLWNEYVKFLEYKYHSKLKTFTFRAKELGWRGYSPRAVFENGTVKTDTSELMIFTRLFFTSLVLRPSCYYCRFANLNRPSDITIGDFWGIEKCLPQFEDEKGVSLVLINTYKGKALFEQIKESSYIEESNIVDCTKYQHNLNQPTQRPVNRDVLWQDYSRAGFNYIAAKYAGYGFSGRTKSMAVKALQRLGLLTAVKQLLRK